MKQKEKFEKKFLIGIAGGVIAWLCCLTPLAVVMLGMASVSYALSLSNLLWGQYWWLFKSGALIFVLLAVLIYLKSKKACSLKGIEEEKGAIYNILKALAITWLILLIVIEILWFFYFPK